MNRSTVNASAPLYTTKDATAHVAASTPLHIAKDAANRVWLPLCVCLTTQLFKLSLLMLPFLPLLMLPFLTLP